MEKKFTIVGNPVSHSVSPRMFKAAYAKYPQFIYIASLMTSAKEAADLYRTEFLGGNVTAPLKEDILNFVDEMTDAVKFIGACNLITRTSEGKLIADNSDYVGVLGSLQEHNINVKDLKCLVLGVGGAGKAATYALKKMGAKVTVVNRTEEKAKEYATKLGVEFSSINNLENLLKDNTVVVNTLYPEIDIIEVGWINEQHTILDASYVKSALLERVKDTGCKCIDGRYWVFHQAIPSFIAFTGIEPDTESMRKVVGI